MAISLDHTIIPASNRQQSAQLLADILGVPWSDAGIGHFTAVYVSESLTLDFDQAEGQLPMLHFAFRMSESQFDAVLARLQAKGIPYRAKPMGPNDGHIGSHQGGRIVYWDEPDGHVWEALTVSYARQPGPSANPDPV
jgi:catechol 2,3-dioxygenase-like lactoylglutathione lyase family enzyme